MSRRRAKGGGIGDERDAIRSTGGLKREGGESRPLVRAIGFNAPGRVGDVPREHALDGGGLGLHAE